MLGETNSHRSSQRSGDCAVCGCTDVVTDEVAHRGRMLLRECPRCRHRWTETLVDSGPFLARRARLVRRSEEVIRAA